MRGQSGIGYKRARDIAALAHLGALTAAKPRIQAVKADVAEQSVTERTAEDAVAEASQIKNVAVERSLKMQTPQLRRSLWSQRRRRLSQRRQR